MSRGWGVGLAAFGVLLSLQFSAEARPLARQIQFGQWNAGSDIVFDAVVADFKGVERRIGFRLAKR
ncbi:MAG: hypothetical protein ABI439_12900, partial [Rhodospirillales bacterium]